jgi:hypothetical protein
VGAMKIYVAVVEALRRNERQGETQFIIEIDGFSEFPHPSPLECYCIFFSFLKISPYL